MGLDSLLLSLDEASRDIRIQGIHLDVDNYFSDWSTTWEIRQALSKFKDSGKWILSYGEQLSQKQYYLASVADELILHPYGEISLTGISMDSIFFGKMFEKIGLNLQAIRGTNNVYKSAIEPLTKDGFSPENLEQMKAIVQQYWSTVSDDITSSRNLEKSKFELLVKTMGPRDADLALSGNLVDNLMEESDIESFIDQEMSADFNEPDTMSLFNYSRHLKLFPFIEEKSFTDSIAIIHADGPIQKAQSSERAVYPNHIKSYIEDALEDEDVKGIVIRVNSPGGGAFASELIHREIEKASKIKPVGISFGSMAASGGYYLSCGANTISASPLTLTGSIGVFGVIPSLGQFLEQNLHITHDGVKTHPSSDAMHGLRPLSPVELKTIQYKIDDVYQLFKQRVSKGRDLSSDETEKVSRGRVWTGIDAIEQGLVDHRHGLIGAIEDMEEHLGLSAEERNLKVWPKTMMWKDWIDELDLNTQIAKALNLDQFELWNSIKHYKTNDQMELIQARFPYPVNIR